MEVLNAGRRSKRLGSDTLVIAGNEGVESGEELLAIKCPLLQDFVS